MPVEKEQDFQIAHVVEQNGAINVRSYEDILTFIENFVESNKDLEINDKDGFNNAKEIRTATNKTIDIIKRHRIDTIKEYTGVFEERCKKLEKILDDFVSGLGKKIKAYDDEQKAVSNLDKPKVITATIKFYDEKLKDKIQAFANKNNCNVTFK